MYRCERARARIYPRGYVHLSSYYRDAMETACFLRNVKMGTMHGIGRHWLMAGSTVNLWLACPLLGSDLPEWRLHVLIMWVPPIVQKHAMFGSLKTLNSGGLKVRKNVSCQSHPDCNNGASEVAKLCDKQFVICSADSQKPNHDYTWHLFSVISFWNVICSFLSTKDSE